MIPSDETLEREGIRLSKETQTRVTLIRNLQPKRIQIYAKDLNRLRAIGKGKWSAGFYRVLAIAHHCWLQDDDIDRLIVLGKGNARAGLIHAIEVAEEKKKCQTQ